MLTVQPGKYQTRLSRIVVIHDSREVTAPRNDGTLAQYTRTVWRGTLYQANGSVDSEYEWESNGGLYTTNNRGVANPNDLSVLIEARPTKTETAPPKVEATEPVELDAPATAMPIIPNAETFVVVKDGLIGIQRMGDRAPAITLSPTDAVVLILRMGQAVDTLLPRDEVDRVYRMTMDREPPKTTLVATDLSAAQAELADSQLRVVPRRDPNPAAAEELSSEA